LNSVTKGQQIYQLWICWTIETIKCYKTFQLPAKIQNVDNRAHGISRNQGLNRRRLSQMQ
jgi:hypothetical protein